MDTTGFNNVSHASAMMPANPLAIAAGPIAEHDKNTDMDLDFLRQARDRFLQTSTAFLGLAGVPSLAVPSGSATSQPECAPPLPAWPFAQPGLPATA